MITLYVFGNEHLDSDNLAIDVASNIPSVKAVHCHSPDDLLDVAESELLIMDVVKGIDKPMLISDPSQLKTRNIVSLHDFDVGYFLNLMESLDMGKRIKIIGVPQKGDPVAIAKEVEQWL
ncbi:MAG: hypothetical protein ABIC95_01475 [archaeon]